MKELDRNKEYITSNLSEERREELIEHLKEEDLEWETLGVDELLDCVLRCEEDGWHSDYEKWASQDAIDANTLFDISDKTEENDLNNGQESNNEVFLKAIKETFKEHNKKVSQLLEEKRNTGMKDLPPFSDWNIPSDYYPFKPNAEEMSEMYDFLQSGTQLVEEASFGAGEKRQFFYHNSEKHGPNFYTKEEVQFHNGEEWTEDLILYTQLGSNKKFATTKERFKKFKEVWI